MKTSTFLLAALILAASNTAHALDCGAPLKSYKSKQVNAKLNCLGKAIDTAYNTFGNLQAQINGLSSIHQVDLASLRSSISTVAYNLAALKNNIPPVTDLSRLNTTIASLQTSVNTINSDIASMKSSMTNLNNGLVSSNIKIDAINKDLISMKPMLLNLNDAVLYLQGHPPPTPIELVYEDDFIKSQVTAVSQTSFTASASFYVKNKTTNPLLLLPVASSFALNNDYLIACTSLSPNLPSSATAPTDPNAYLLLDPNSSISITLTCSSLSNNYTATYLDFSGNFWRYSTTGPSILSVAFTRVALK